MKRLPFLVWIACLCLLAACSAPAAVASPPASTPPAAATLVPSPAVTAGGQLSAPDLKYRLLTQFPSFFYCDPDYYPIARAIDPVQLARQRLPDIEADVGTFQAILAHNGLTGLTDLTDEQAVLIYGDYKKLAALQLQPEEGGYAFKIVTSSSKLQGVRIEGRIDSSGNITVQSQTPTIATCPICLSAQTSIDTPRGPVLVTDLKDGDLVWTMTAEGRRLAEPVLELRRTPVPATHEVIHLVLTDGRELWASAGHPTTDGRHLGDLVPGDLVDGGRVVLAGLVLYGQPATYDLLPAGGTGYYWANGILLASTLAVP